MSNNMNAKVLKSAEAFGRKLDFYRARTTLALGGEVGSEEQDRLDTLAQTIALNGQAIVFEVFDAETVTDPVGFPAGEHEVTDVHFIIEHHKSWGADEAEAAEALKEALVATGLFGEDEVAFEVRYRL